MESNDRTPLVAGIEAGGTKMVLGIGTATGGSVATATVPTGEPGATLAAMAAFFDEATQAHPVRAVGIASFGPIDLDPASPSYGRIVSAPKLAWNGFDLLGGVRAVLGGIPGAIDTDVNGAALAEARAAGQGDLAYVTIGTGIGVGIVANGRTIHGAGHPEMGHILPRRHPAHGDFAGVCPFHGDCLEGLASGPAIKAAWGESLDHLPEDHPAWGAQADYLGQLAATLILSVASPRIVFGGGVMGQQRLFPAVRDRAAAILAGYGRGNDRNDMDARIVPPASAEPPGLIGAYMLAETCVAV